MEPNVQQGYPQVQGAPVVSLKDWMITILLMAIPVVNLIMLFVWAFGGGTNPSKSNFAKASLIWALIGIVIYVIFFVLIIGAISSSM
ncbi:hypothetical protein [Paenibacillus sp. DYY-L-2]|uniref:hypothetical protein n=1 Tax=Paenibacillus sp. DYY-L-2 TaxID=3447013 RepID=UPI003F504EDA